MPSKPLLFDDRVLVALLVGEDLPIADRAVCFTTMYFYLRACRAVLAGVGGHLSGPFERLDPKRSATALLQMLTLPDNVGLPDPRQLVPVMVNVYSRHPNLGILNAEATAAALMLEAKMVVSRPTANGQLGSVLPDEGIAFQTVDLP